MSESAEVGPVCPVCGNDLEWVDCPECEDGEVNRYDEDPTYYGSEDDAWFVCSLCNGAGGWNVCPVCHPRACNE